MKLNDFPVKDGNINRKILIVDLHNNIFTGHFYQKDDNHSCDECSLEWKNDNFEGSSFYPTEYLKGWVEFPEINEVPEKMDIQLTKQNLIDKKLEYIMNTYGYDTRLNTPDFILARYIINMLDNLENFNQLRDSWSK